MTEKPVKYSIIFLCDAEEVHENSFHYIQSLYELFSTRHDPFEFLIINNGMAGFFRNEIGKLLIHNKKIHAFEFATKTTLAVCLKAGLEESHGDIFLIFGSYQQISNDSLLEMLDQLDSDTDLVTPWRENRVDSPLNQFQSKIFNWIVRKLTSSTFHDLSSTVRVLRKQVFEATEIYGNMYRFLPILADRKGFKAKEVKCQHYQQLGIGKSGFYSLSRYFSTFIDILTLYFNTRFTRKPLRFFSAIGMTFLSMGLIIAAYVFIQRIIFEYPIGGRPVLLLALLFIVLGIQAASVGLLGEIIAFTQGRNRKEYSIEKML